MKKLFVLFLLVLLVSCSEVKGDIPYTNEQVMSKAKACDKQGFAIQMVYDDLWDVYAVKCIKRGRLPNGKEKSIHGKKN